MAMAKVKTEAVVEGYVSPLGRRIQVIRDRIVANAEERDWTIDRDSLDDRHIVRRIVPKRCVYHYVVADRCVGINRVSRIGDYRHARELGEPIGDGSTRKRVHTFAGSLADQGRWQLLDETGTVVGHLATSFRPPDGMQCRASTVLAVVGWSRESSKPKYRDTIKCDSWEVVVPELVFEPH